MKFGMPGLNGIAIPLEPRVSSFQLLATISIAIGNTSVASEKNAPRSRKQGQLIGHGKPGRGDHDAGDQADPGRNPIVGVDERP